MLTDTATADQSDELDDVVDGLRSFLRAEVIERHRERPHLSETKHQFDPSGRFTTEVLDEILAVRTASAEAGYYAMLTPVELGGGGLGFEALYRVWETIYRECGSLNWLGYWSVAHWARGPSQVLLHASEHVRDKVVPGLLAGTESMCFAMSEPDAGSDAWMMSSTAERVDGGWALSGTKTRSRLRIASSPPGCPNISITLSTRKPGLSVGTRNAPTPPRRERAASRSITANTSA